MGPWIKRQCRHNTHLQPARWSIHLYPEVLKRCVAARLPEKCERVSRELYTLWWLIRIYLVPFEKGRLEPNLWSLFKTIKRLFKMTQMLRT
jgi:hypothetical protein